MEKEILIDTPPKFITATDFHAVSCDAYIRFCSGILDLAYLFNIPENKAKAVTAETSGSKKVFQFPLNGMTEWWIYEVLPTETKWQIDLDSANTGDNRKRFCELSESEDGKTGSLQIDEWHRTYEWEFLEGDVFHLISNCLDTLYDIVSYPDKSGHLTAFSSGVIKEFFTWDATGAGTWVTYTNGIQDGEGSWSGGE